MQLKTTATLFLLLSSCFSRGEPCILFVNKQDRCNREGMPFTNSEKTASEPTKQRQLYKYMQKADKTRLYSSTSAPHYPPVLKRAVELHLSILVKSTYKNIFIKLHEFNRDLSKIICQKIIYLLKNRHSFAPLGCNGLWSILLSTLGLAFFLLGLQTLDCLLS